MFLTGKYDLSFSSPQKTLKFVLVVGCIGVELLPQPQESLFSVYFYACKNHHYVKAVLFIY